LRRSSTDTSPIIIPQPPPLEGPANRPSQQLPAYQSGDPSHPLHLFTAASDLCLFSASEVTTSRRYTNLFIVILKR